MCLLRREMHSRGLSCGPIWWLLPDAELRAVGTAEYAVDDALKGQEVEDEHHTNGLNVSKSEENGGEHPEDEYETEMDTEMKRVAGGDDGFEADTDSDD